MKENSKRIEKVKNYYENKIKNFEILVDNIYDVHNVSAISRSADGLGIETINLYYTYNKMPDIKKKGKKSSSTANKWIKFNKITNINEFVNQKKREGYLFIGVDLVKEGQLLNSFVFPDKCIIVLGGEREGMSKEIKDIIDKFVFIPMVGMVESYNVSVACALTMYEIFCQKGGMLKIREQGL